MKPKRNTRRRRFTRKTREQLNLLQRLREQVRLLLPLVPYNREPEMQAFDALIVSRQDDLLDGRRLDHDRMAIREAKLIGRFQRHIVFMATRDPSYE